MQFKMPKMHLGEFTVRVFTMKKQQSFTDLEYSTRKRKTKRADDKTMQDKIASKRLAVMA